MQRNDGRKALGQRGEEDACAFLEKRGIQIVDRNFRCKMGEVDIVGIEREYVVFIEVKARKATTQKISPFISITPQKCRRIRRISELYRLKKKMLHRQPRFDVIGITYESEQDFTVEYIQNAF